MKCSDAERLIFTGRDGGLVEGEHADLENHVANCAACRRTRESLTAAVEAWRTVTRTVAAPDAEREWQAVRRQIRNSTPAPRSMARWFAVPIGAAAAAVIAFFVVPNLKPVSNSFAATQRDSVEVSAADGSVVFVDDKSGWVVVWEGEGAAQKI